MIKTTQSSVEDLGKVRLGGFAPTLAPSHDAGKVRLGGFAPTLGPSPKAPTRRVALKVSVAGLAGAVLAACSTKGQTSGQIAQTVVTYAADIANGLAQFAANAVNLPNAATLAGFAADAVKAANALSTAMTQSAAQPVITQINSDVAAVINAIRGLTISPQAAAILQDIELALQILLPLVGLVASPVVPIPPAAVTAEPGFRGAPARSLDPAIALVDLRGLPTVTVNGVSATNR